MTQFNVGDRVKIYGDVSGYFSNGQKATVIRLHPTYDPPHGWIAVEYTVAGDVYKKYVHPKQCRKLKPKAKPILITKEELARAWDKEVYPVSLGGSFMMSSCSNAFDAFCKELGFE